jgi:putative membrane protein
MNHNMTKMTELTLAALLLAAWSPAAGAADAPKPAEAPAVDSKAGAVPSQDVNFMMKAANSGRAEVELARLALERATSKPVKDLARRMLEDHGKANEQLREIARGKKVPLPDQLTGIHRNLVEQIRAEDQADFEQAYMQAQVAEHKAAIALFRDEKTDGVDPALREFAGAQLPMLEKHLDEALRIADGLVQSGRDRESAR